MPWKPSADVFDHYDSRLDDFYKQGRQTHHPFRTVLRHCGSSSSGLLHPDGRAFWWRKFSEPVEIVQGHIFFADGQYDDWVSSSLEEVLEDLADWRCGEFTYRGITYRADWLDENASAQVRKAFLYARH